MLRRALPTALAAPEHVQGAVAADGVEPLGEAVVDFCWRLVAEAEEGELDDVAGVVETACQPLGIPQQPTLILVECVENPLAMVGLRRTALCRTSLHRTSWRRHSVRVHIRVLPCP